MSVSFMYVWFVIFFTFTLLTFTFSHELFIYFLLKITNNYIDYNSAH